MSRPVKHRTNPTRTAPTSGPAEAAKRTEVKITPAKGRPMLTWVGKRPLSHVTAFPAQHIETFDPLGTLAKPPADPDLWRDWPTSYPRGGLLFHGDNKEVLAHLLANGFRGKVNLNLYRSSLRLRRELCAQGKPPRDGGNSQDRRRELRFGRADPVHGHLG